MAAGSRRKQQRKRTLVVRLDALATNRIVIEVPPRRGIARSVAVGLVNPPATQCDAVTIERLAAEIRVLEIKPNTTKEMKICIVTAVPGDAAYEVARTWHRWPDLLEAKERLEQSSEEVS